MVKGGKMGGKRIDPPLKLGTKIAKAVKCRERGESKKIAGIERFMWGEGKVRGRLRRLFLF